MGHCFFLQSLLTIIAGVDAHLFEPEAANNYTNGTKMLGYWAVLTWEGKLVRLSNLSYKASLNEVIIFLWRDVRQLFFGSTCSLDGIVLHVRGFYSTEKK